MEPGYLTDSRQAEVGRMMAKEEIKEEVKEEPLSEKGDDGGGERQYCTCRSTKSDGFMIMCEHCTEWFHGNCIDVEESFAKNISRYYCQLCISKNDGQLQIVYTKKYIERRERQRREEEAAATLPRCGECIGCFRMKTKVETCKTCEYCEKGQFALCGSLRCVQLPPLPVKKKVGRPRREAPALRSTDDEDGAFTSPHARDDHADKPKRGRKKGWRKSQQLQGGSPAKVIKSESADGEDAAAVSKVVPLLPDFTKHFARACYRVYRQRSQKASVEPPRHCLGPICTEEARETSKFCSDACGRALARERVKQYMPGRVVEYWETIPTAEIRAAAACREKEETMKVINARVLLLLQFSEMLERYAASLKSTVPQDDADDQPDHGGTGFCTVCGAERASKDITGHIERCFVKTEKQLSFGGNKTYETQTTRGLFCNEYNISSDNYCKRLRVMCPEHYKGELEKDMKVCGAPKIWEGIKSLTFEDVFVSPDKLMSKHFCMAPRKDCAVHQRWLQKALGLVDTERMNILLKLGEHSDSYNQLKSSIAARGDLVSLMCNGKKPRASATS